jgi:hypothetical protein
MVLKNIVFRGERFDYVVERDANGQISAKRQGAS